MDDSTRRFSTRVDAYVHFRPGYPSSLLDFLKDECQLKPDSIIADVGSGTGLMAELFLLNGNRVHGIEPNPEMRQAAEHRLKSCSRFHSIGAIAESTPLRNQSVDFVTVGRAFHWFDQEKALSEFWRILKPGGWVIIVWMKRKPSTSFLDEYEELLLAYAKDYRQMKERRLDSEALLRQRAFKRKTLDDQRFLDLESLKGQTLSYSVSPEVGDANYTLMQDALCALFQRHQQNGRVRFTYDLVIYYAKGGLSVERTSNLLASQASID